MWLKQCGMLSGKEQAMLFGAIEKLKLYVLPLVGKCPEKGET